MSTQSHYEGHSKDSYESAYFYSPGPYMNYLSRLVRQKLHLTSDYRMERTILDVGGGTGNFTQLVVEGSPNVRARVVDPFLERPPADMEQIEFVKEPAEALKMMSSTKPRWRKGYDQVLMKEVIHHISDSDRLDVFKGIHGDLSSLKKKEHPYILIVTRPHEDVDYPLWDAALGVWKENQPSLDMIQEDIIKAGFMRVEHSIEAYPCKISLEKWQSMVKGRFWSTFSHFSDNELEEACLRIATEHSSKVDDNGVLHFEDRLLFITAYR